MADAPVASSPRVDLAVAPPLLAIALLSAAALAYEVLLTRLFSIILWHHFAYMIISVALLGYGAAGTFVALTRRQLLAHFEMAFAAGAVVFGIGAIAGFALAQRVGFNPLELLWDAAQPLRLGAIYGALFVPFFGAASSICLALTRFSGEPHLVYSFDILGAGAGSLAIIAALFVLVPTDALRVVGALGPSAAAVALFSAGAGRRTLAVALLALAVVLGWLTPDSWVRLRPSEYKDESQMLRIDGTRVVAQRSSPLGLVTVVESTRIPLRYAPGLSLNATTEPPPQLAVFADGDGPSAMVNYDGRREPLAYLDQLTSALPYHLLRQPRVLVLGSGAGADVLQAIYHRARTIDAVELNPQIVDLTQRTFARFSGAPYAAAGVGVAIGEARGFVASSAERFDLIQVALLDAFSASSAGLHALSESFVYTVEALHDYVHHLAPGGFLALTRWVNLPPRDTLKLFATAVAALERDGAQPGSQLVLIRGWKTATLLVKNGALTADDLAAIREFCRARSFDIEYAPGIERSEANRYNVLDQPSFFDGAQALLGNARDDFIDRYKFDIAPATDDRPYFHHFFKWRTLPELFALKSEGGLPLLEWGYPVLVATLVQAMAASVLLVMLPLAVAARGTRKDSKAAPPTLRVVSYFLAIGVAFMFVEIAFIQKFQLLLSHPLYAIAVVLASFLAFAGLGSRFAGRRRAANAPAENIGRRAVTRVAIALGVLCIGYLATLPSLFRLLGPLPDAIRILIAVALIAPLAFAMGMPFPIGLARTAARAPSLVPWAWAINGCASVVAAIAATLTAIHAGFGAVVVTAALLYALAIAVLP